MDYVELPPPPALRQHLQCLWRLRAAAGRSAIQTIYPDGRCELIVHLAEPLRRFSLDAGWQTQARCLFVGQMRCGIRLASDQQIDCVGLRLTAAASGLLVGAELGNLIDQVVDLHSIDTVFAAEMSVAATCYAESNDPDPLWQLLEQRIGSMRPDPAVEWAALMIDEAHGDIAIAPLAQQLGLSVRSLQIRFRRDVGLSAKEYARVQRLQATLQQLDGKSTALSALSADLGYADQAHATREVQRFTGLTPARLRQALRAEREGDDTLRLAAAFVRGHAGVTPPPAAGPAPK